MKTVMSNLKGEPQKDMRIDAVDQSRGARARKRR
jgi:hypothetical protein